MLTIVLALLAGVSAAFAAWLCCVAFSDCFLAFFSTTVAAAAEIHSLESPHERRA